MKERPILFNGPMVRAILADKKTQTRRPITSVARLGVVTEFQVTKSPGYDFIMRDKRLLWNDLRHADLLSRCPFGVVGDRLWVRETWAPYKGSQMAVVDLDDADAARYAADEVIHLAQGNDGCMVEGLDMYAMPPHREMPNGPHRWRPSIHMPRWAARITLEVTDVRVERLRNISDDDAVAEGVERGNGSMWRGGPHRIKEKGCKVFNTASDAFVDRFHAIYPGVDNPWVWAVSFKRIDAKARAA